MEKKLIGIILAFSIVTLVIGSLVAFAAYLIISNPVTVNINEEETLLLLVNGIETETVNVGDSVTFTAQLSAPVSGKSIDFFLSPFTSKIGTADTDTTGLATLVYLIPIEDAGKVLTITAQCNYP